MSNKKLWRVLIPIVLFLILLAVRMFFSLQIPFLSDDSYLHLEKAENLQNIRTDNIVFYYFLTLLLLISKNAVFIKFFSNLFFVLTSLMVYFIALKVSKSSFFSFVSALISGFLPVYFSQTFNSLIPLSFGLFLFFFNIFAYLKSEKKSWLVVAVVSFMIFSFSHWLVFVYILGLAVYHFLLRVEGIKQRAGEIELALFSIFFGLWALIFTYKKVLLLHGLNFLSFNIPVNLLSVYFPQYSFSQIMTFLGVIPFIVGLYMIYKYSFEKKGKEITFIISFVALVAVLFWFKFCFTNIALILLGLFFCILLSRWFVDFVVFVKKTKSAKFVNLFVLLVLVLIALVVIPSSLFYANESLKSSQIFKSYDALMWIKYNSPADAVVLSMPVEGSLVNYFANRKTVINTDFFSAPNADERLDDVYRIYQTNFATEAVELLNKYDVSFILFSEYARNKLDVDKLEYVDASWCFKKVYKGETLVYQKNPKCRLRVVR